LMTGSEPGPAWVQTRIWSMDVSSLPACYD
jgi:hypothetical protein